tara:strand:- start:71 stop:268 length:198 start_codon:yes stop_codon:yes gene_type:complete
MAGIGKYTEGKKFTLKSGNTPDKSSFFKAAGNPEMVQAQLMSQELEEREHAWREKIERDRWKALS